MGSEGGRERERPLILTQNSKMSSLVRARSLLSNLNTSLVRGLALEPHQLKVERSKSCGQLFPLSKGFYLVNFPPKKDFFRFGKATFLIKIWLKGLNVERLNEPSTTHIRSPFSSSQNPFFGSSWRCVETMAAGGAINWMSPMIPTTIRRPWRVFNEDLEDELARALAAWEAVKERGARAAFASLPEEVQRTYAEVSLMELSAYVCWRNHWGFIDEAAWHALHCDDKVRWIPEDHRTVLMADAIWAPLLVDGPPACDVASTLPADDASSIGSEEQNLDLPKRLKSCQAPESHEPTCGEVAQYASGTCTTAAPGLQNRGKRMIHVSSKQSGVPGVGWQSSYKLGAWQVSWEEEKKMKKKYFHVLHFMKTSKTFCEAEADALRAAIEFRKGLERSGIAKAKRVENHQSGVKGINWHTSKKAWTVRLKINGKQLCGGTFKPKDSTPEEVERARLAALDSRRKLEEKYFD